MSGAAVGNNLRALIGQVIRQSDRGVRVQVSKLKLDTFINKYFNNPKFYWCTDGGHKLTEGDIVLINPLPEPKNAFVRFEVKNIVFKVGQTVDPVTGRRCRGSQYIDEQMRNFKQSATEKHETEL